MRSILHVDMDAFYASVEERDRPELRGKPLIVGGTSARAVVAAASYAVRRSACVRQCRCSRPAPLPRGHLDPPRMARYQEISAQVFEIFREFTPLVEGCPWTKRFSTSRRVNGCSAVPRKSAPKSAAESRGKELTASVGIAPNKLLAKIASEFDKPDGMCRIGPGNLRDILDPHCPFKSCLG